ncbi:6816_t:CDS:1, partial [Gigaspora rosea]
KDDQTHTTGHSSKKWSNSANFQGRSFPCAIPTNVRTEPHGIGME